MLKSPPLAAVLLAAALTLPGAEAGISYFPFVKEVRMPSAAARSGQGAEIPLDAEVFDAVENPVRECRVFTASGAEVPFAEARRKGQVRRTRAVPLAADLAMTGENSGVIRIPEGLDANIKVTKFKSGAEAVSPLAAASRFMSSMALAAFSLL